LNAVRAQCGRNARDGIRQLAICKPPLRALLVPEHDRLATIAIAQQILGEVESRAHEPLRAKLGIGRCDAIAPDEWTFARHLRIAGSLNEPAEAAHLDPEQFEVYN